MAEEITKVLKYNDWQFVLESSILPREPLNPDVVQSVLLRNQLNTHPKRLLDFFHWSNYQMGSPQNLNSFSILALVLINSNLFSLANGLLSRMMETQIPVSTMLSSLLECCKECDRLKSRSVVFELLIDAYRKRGMLNEAFSVFLGAKDGFFLPNLLCCNSLLKDLLRGNRMELFWMVYEGMAESKLDLDVYSYTTVINAYFKVGSVREAKRILGEMEYKGYNPNLVTYNVVIKGLCRSGDLDEALRVKKSMAENGFIPDQYTYTHRWFLQAEEVEGS